MHQQNTSSIKEKVKVIKKEGTGVEGRKEKKKRKTN
jgi:hypothetical protein